ncbi:alpha/beta fold hydrolase [Pendulispora albinea]|uniref:Alpha/beta hydrolase n=1 Tax=Pendulispora albinea TaxID=2741071 RepID=A0ABZ2LZM7_9BACT
MTSDRFIERDGVRIHYLDQGRGTPVLLLHAYPLHGAMFQPQLDALASKYRFIVPDHRGFGKSGPPLAEASEMAQLAGDALAVLDALQIQQAVIGGVSMGGYIAMALLNRAPERFKALILADTQSTADDDAARKKREEAARKALESGMRGVAEAMLPQLLAPDTPESIRTKVTNLVLENSPQGAAAAQRGMALRVDSAEALSRYPGPSLVLVGEKDPITPPEKAKKLASLLKNATLVVIPNAGHLSNLESPGPFNHALDTFLSRI